MTSASARIIPPRVALRAGRVSNTCGEILRPIRVVAMASRTMALFLCLFAASCVRGERVLHQAPPTPTPIVMWHGSEFPPPLLSSHRT